jgi:inward rectifier potassium channel
MPASRAALVRERSRPQLAGWWERVMPRWLQPSGKSGVHTTEESHFETPATYLLNADWARFWMANVAMYLLLVFFFAVAFYVDADALSVQDARPSLADAFFFSVQTFTTIGYGTISPTSRWADAVVVVESFIGAAYMTAISGLLFVRVSRPKSHIAFAEVAVVAGDPLVLSVRVVNTHPRVRLLDTHVRLSVMIKVAA